MKNNKKILLIEDNKVIADNAIEIAEFLEIKLTSARTHAEAEEALQHVMSYDEIFLDGCLGPTPGLDTLPLLEKIKRAGFDKPIIAISNNYNDEMIKAGATRGADKCNLMRELTRIANSD